MKPPQGDSRGRAREAARPETGAETRGETRGARIRRLRGELSQQALADAIGAAGKHIVSGWETDATAPSAEYRAKLAAYFGVSEQWIEYGDAGLDAVTQERIARARAEGFREGVAALADQIPMAVAQLARKLADDYLRSLTTSPIRIAGSVEEVFGARAAPSQDGQAGAAALNEDEGEEGAALEQEAERLRGVRPRRRNRPA